MKTVYNSLIYLFILGLMYSLALGQATPQASNPKHLNRNNKGKTYVEPQKHLRYRPCGHCCPETAWHERDPNEPFLKDFKTRESYGRVWVNGYYCANGNFVDGHWHFLDEDNASQATTSEPEELNRPLNTDTNNDLEEQYTTTMVSEGNVWVKPYYDENGKLVPGHWRKLPEEKE